MTQGVPYGEDPARHEVLLDGVPFLVKPRALASAINRRRSWSACRYASFTRAVRRSNARASSRVRGAGSVASRVAVRTSRFGGGDHSERMGMAACSTPCDRFGVGSLVRPMAVSCGPETPSSQTPFESAWDTWPKRCSPRRTKARLLVQLPALLGADRRPAQRPFRYSLG